MARETAADRRAREAADAAVAEASDPGNGEQAVPIGPPADDSPETALENRVAELEGGQTAILEQVGAIADTVGAIAERLAQPAPAAVVEQPVPLPEGTPSPEDVLPRLPDGVARFRSLRFTEPTYIMEPGYMQVVNGRAIPVAPKQVDFLHGIADVKDPEKIEFMRTHPEYGLSFVEDDTALPMRTGPIVVDGARGAGRTPRDPMAAPAAALSAPLT